MTSDCRRASSFARSVEKNHARAGRSINAACAGERNLPRDQILDLSRDSRLGGGGKIAQFQKTMRRGSDIGRLGGSHRLEETRQVKLSQQPLFRSFSL